MNNIEFPITQKQFLDLPPEIYKSVLDLLDLKSVLNLSMTCKKCFNYSYFSKNIHVKKLFLKNFNSDIESIFQKNDKKVIEFCYKIGFLPKPHSSTKLLISLLSAQACNETFLSVFNLNSYPFRLFFLYTAAAQGKKKFFTDIFKNIEFLEEYKLAFKSACRFGNMQIFQLLVKCPICQIHTKDTILDRLIADLLLDALKLSLKNGHMEISKILITIIEMPLIEVNLESILLTIVKSKNYIILKLFLNEYVKVISLNLYVFRTIIRKAILIGKIKILKLLFNFYDLHFYNSQKIKMPFSYICYATSNLKVLNYLLINERLYLCDLDFSGINQALENGNINILKIILLKKLYKKSPYKTIYHDQNVILKELKKIISLKPIIMTSRKHNLKMMFELVKILSKTKFKTNFYYNFFLKIIINYGNPTLFEFCLKNNLDIHISDEIITHAIKRGSIQFLEVIFRYIKVSNYDLLNDIILSGNVDLLTLFLKQENTLETFISEDIPHKLIRKLVKDGNVKMLDLIINQVEILQIPIIDCCLKALKNNDWHMIQFLINSYAI